MWYDDGGNKVVQPPPCHVCKKPVPGVAAQGHGERFFHGDCYRTFSNERWANQQTSTKCLAAMSHEERVADGLEYP